MIVAAQPKVAAGVEREAVRGHGAAHPDPDGAELAVRALLIGEHPDAATPLDPGRRHAEVGAGANRDLLEPLDVGDDVDRQGRWTIG